MIFASFLRSSRAASLVEYTILAGIMTSVVIAVVWVISQNVGDRFVALRDALTIEPAAGPSSASGGCASGSQGLGDENCASNN
jgi:Flp pilus assembly pilin Flp